ncbi:MAG: aminopeptidase P family protein [Acidobacteria bacterium]|nr:aminopeptidase P family protein [Acidobacteriota bacterium]
MNPPTEAMYRQRLSKLRTQMRQRKQDALLITSLPNVHYLTGFSGSAGMLLVGLHRACFFSDPRYDLQAQEEVQGSRVAIVRGDLLKAAAKQALRGHFSKLGFEGDTIAWQTYRKLRELLPSKRLAATSGLVESLRLEKDEEEIEQIRRAVELASRAFSDTLPVVRPGVRELDIAAELEYRMRLYGGEKPAFETIVASGSRTALPHARASTRQLRSNECILMDLGVILNGYASDMTRTVFLGKAPRKAAEMYRAVLEAQLAAEEAVRAGAECSTVDAAARKVLQQYGYARYFTHSTGHGLGREVHEIPRVAPKQRTPLPERAVITVEPGVYISGYGGVRIEDVVVVRKEGAEVLTRTPKELTVL